MKKNVLTFLLLGIFIFTSYSQVNCLNYGTADFPRTIEGQVYQWNPTAWNFPYNTGPNYPNMVQTKVSNLNEANGFLKGLLEFKPSDYNTGNNTKHPILIFFHGTGGVGTGSPTDLCRLFKDRGIDLATHKAIPGLVENFQSRFVVNDGVTTRGMIVVSPQYSRYDRNYNNPASQIVFPGPSDVEKMIDYILLRYPNKIDTRRIYLTGYSSGANMIMEYVGSSVARAKRIAAVLPVSLCSQVDHISNVDANVSAANIGTAKLKTWFVYCQTDNCGFPVTPDGDPTTYNEYVNTPIAWVNGIKAVAGHSPPRLTTLKNLNPATLYNCSDTLTHDAWSRAYDPNFKASFLSNGLGANDGINLNAYEWLAQAQAAVLPVVLQSYSARLVSDRVEINWVTSDEKDNKSFTIERAGPDQKFKAIGTVPGAVNNTGNKEYSFIDNSPLADLSFYRLVQNDIDGEKTYFDIKKIINRNGKQNAISVTPNPFGSELSAYISLSRSQKVFISVTDMTGKTVKSTNGVYGQGSSEIKIPAQDLSKGIYLFKVSGEDFSTTQKIVKK